MPLWLVRMPLLRRVLVEAHGAKLTELPSQRGGPPRPGREVGGQRRGPGRSSGDGRVHSD